MRAETEKAIAIIKEYDEPKIIMAELFDAKRESFGTFDLTETMSGALDNQYASPKDLNCFIGNTEFSDVIPLVSKNLNDFCKMGALEKLMRLDSSTLDSIVSEHGLW